jgi:hypothetical protein
LTHFPFQQRIGRIPGQSSIGGQSKGFFLHVLSKHLNGDVSEQVINVPQTLVVEAFLIIQVPSEQEIVSLGHSCQSGHLVIDSLHELSQHRTGELIGHTIIVGQLEILSLQLPSKHLIRFASGILHELFC